MPPTESSYSPEFREAVKNFILKESSMSSELASGYVERVIGAMSRYDDEREADSLPPVTRMKIVDEFIVQAELLLNGLQMLDKRTIQMFKELGVGTVKVERELMALEHAAKKLNDVLRNAGIGGRKGGRPSDPYRKNFIRALSKIFDEITGKKAKAYPSSYNRGHTFQDMVKLCTPAMMPAPPSAVTIHNDLKG